jgi:lysophospholipase L1-like esterase
VRPPAALSWSGPGQAELFGEGAVPTVQQFHGFIRPAIAWQRFDQSAAASRFIQSSTSGHAARADVEAEVEKAGQAMASGWAHYVVHLVLLAAGMGAALHLAAVGTTVLARGRDRPPVRGSRLRVLLAALLSGALTAAFVGVTVVSAYRQLRDVHSLADLVGTSQFAPVPKADGPVHGHADIVVIGDSTAAGLGNALVRHPTREDRDCDRSRESYAQALQSVTRTPVLNLACSSATIEQGLLGPQTRGGTTLTQVSRLKAVSPHRAVIVSIGANDVGWTDFVRYCAVTPQCGNPVTEQLFESRLNTFKIQYAQLLQQLAQLPGHPTVIVNQYYDPLGTSLDCLQPSVTPTPGSSSSSGPPAPSGLVDNLNTMRSEIAHLNAVLARGAAAFHDVVVQPDFAGHTLCTAQPWVQGPGSPAPLHPTSAGELAIAAADLPYLLGD